MEEIVVKLKESIKEWPGARVRYREDWQCNYFSVADKCFALLGKHAEWGWQLAIKGNPSQNEELREQYDFIVPGYHLNKSHWNSIILNKSTLDNQELIAMLMNSYELVVAKLPKKTRETL